MSVSGVVTVDVELELDEEDCCDVVVEEDDVTVLEELDDELGDELDVGLGDSKVIKKKASPATTIITTIVTAIVLETATLSLISNETYGPAR